MVDVRPLRILYFHPTRTFGGAERTTRHLLERSDPGRVRLTLLAMPELLDRMPLDRVERALDADRLGIREWFAAPEHIARDAATLADLLAGDGFDAAFGMMHYASAVLALARQRHGAVTPFVASPRGPTGAFLRDCLPDERARSVLREFTTLFCRAARLLVVPGQGTAEDCVALFGAEPRRIRVIPNGIDADGAARLARQTPPPLFEERGFVLSASGRLSSEKDFDVIVGALKELPDRVRATLVLVGDGPERPSLERTVDALGLRRRVALVGFRENPLAYVAASDVFLHASRVEGFGNAILEAMACGVPVVAADAPSGPRELIRHGENGILFPRGDRRALAGAVLDLFDHPERRARIAAMGRETALRYPVAGMVQAYERAFAEAAGR